MKRIFVIAMLGVALAGTHSSIAADAPSASRHVLAASCPMNGGACGQAACDPATCPMPCTGSCPMGGAAATAADVE